MSVKSVTTRTLKNGLVILLARGLVPATSFLIGIYIARAWGAPGFGQYVFVLSCCFLFHVVFSCGLGHILTREVAQEPGQAASYLVNGGVFGLASSLVGWVALVLASDVLWDLDPGTRSALLVASFSLLPSAFALVAEALLIALGQSGRIAAVLGVEAGIRVALSLWALGTGRGIVALMAIFLLSRLVTGLLYGVLMARQLRPLRWRIDLSLWGHLLGLMPTFGLLYFFSAIQARVDVLMLASFQGLAEVGIYSTAYKLMEIGLLVPASFVTALFPLMAQSTKHPRGSLASLCRRSMIWATALFLPLSVGLALLADRLVPRVYSSQFFPSVLPFRILICLLFPYSIDQILAHALIAINRQRLSLVANGLAMGANVLLNLVLIPRWGTVGASLAMLASTGLTLLLHGFYVRRELRRPGPGQPSWEANGSRGRGLQRYVGQEASP